jgi:hypothetical protein
VTGFQANQQGVGWPAEQAQITLGDRNRV